LSNQQRHRELAVWALRYAKNPEVIKDYLEYQKTMEEVSDSESNVSGIYPPGYVQGLLNDIDSAIAWLKNLE
jgi:hypothetical protein